MSLDLSRTAARVPPVGIEHRVGIAWRKVSTATKVDAASIVLVVVVCGFFSEYFIEEVIGAIGWFARHDESTLRLLGAALLVPGRDHSAGVTRFGMNETATIKRTAAMAAPR